MIAAVLEGFALGASLIIAIGAQNAYVIRQGIKHDHVLAVVLTCALIDCILIAIGAAGVGALIAQSEAVRSIAAWGGAFYLFVFGVLSIRAALAANVGQWEQAEHDADERGRGAANLKTAVLAAAAFSLLNPHVYLDTVVLLGGIAGQYEADVRLYFTLGAMAASLMWFSMIGFGARLLSPCFRTVTGTRILESIVAMTMFSIAAMLVFGELRG